MTADELARAAMALPGWTLRSGMVGTVHGQRCVVLGPDEGPEDERHGEWLVMPCSGEWDLSFMCRDYGDYVDYCLSTRTDEFTPDIDDPATAGCLFDMLGSGWSVFNHYPRREYTAFCPPFERGNGPSLGAACVAAAIALGRWPGGLNGGAE